MNILGLTRPLQESALGIYLAHMAVQILMSKDNSTKPWIKKNFEYRFTYKLKIIE